MDKGNLLKSGVKLNTNSFSREEVEYLCEVLRRKFKIENKIIKTDENRYIIFIKEESKEKYIKRISKYLTEGMKDRKKIGDSKYSTKYN
jgi:hypothetical protein